MAYYPGGDPEGKDDGYPGSIFATGHDHQQYVAEISIFVPMISPNKRLDKLNTARTLQSFQDINDMFGHLEIPCAGLAYFPAQGSPSKGKLYFCWGQHFQFEQVPSHGWCEINLSRPDTSGPWPFDGYSNYVTNDYLFDIPRSWADANTPDQRLATGRFREGSWSGRGPALFAFGPSTHGKPHGPNATLKNLTPLLLYGKQLPGIPEIQNHDTMGINGYQACDHWSGGAWLTAGDRSAVVFAGTKTVGRCWYGFANGVVWPIDCTPGARLLVRMSLIGRMTTEVGGVKTTQLTSCSMILSTLPAWQRALCSPTSLNRMLFWTSVHICLTLTLTPLDISEISSEP
jgi:hypothetical protein